MAGSAVRKRLGEMLVDAGLIDEVQLGRALDVQRMGGGRLGSILVRLRFITDRDFRDVLRRQLGVEIVEVPEAHILTPVVGLLPLEMMRRLEAIPVVRSGASLTVGMRDPYDLGAIEEVRSATAIEDVRVTLLTDQGFERLMDACTLGQALIDDIRAGEPFYQKALRKLRRELLAPSEQSEPEQRPLPVLGISPGAGPVENLASYLIMEAYRRGASDLHLQPREGSTEVRVRTDGLLAPLLSPPRDLHAPLIDQIRALAGAGDPMPRGPWQGRLTALVDGDRVRLRVATLPTLFGDSCTIRISRATEHIADLGSLPLTDAQRESIVSGLEPARGLVLVAGPGGSGKTTTLLALLMHLADPSRSLVSIEDAVDTPLPGVAQVEASPEAGMTLQSTLRSVLFQDPDVLMLPDLDEASTASIAVRAAMKGTLILSTLHTGSAVEALVRLGDLEIEPYVVSSTVQLVVSQRLVRTVCEACAEPTTARDADLRLMGLTPDRLEGAHLRRGAGCSRCNHTGYRGRTPLFEVLRVTDSLRRLIRTRAGQDALRESARLHSGFETLQDDGVRKVLAGVTTFEEVRRALG